MPWCVGFSQGFPAARDPRKGEAWLAHCYGMVGAGRGNEPDSGYEKAEQGVRITSVRMAADLPVAERAGLEVLRTDTERFQQLVEARRNRRDDWYLAPAGYIDLCNVPLVARPRP